MAEGTRAKPRHLGPEYAAQFGDEEVAAAYHHRPPYPAAAFAFVHDLLGPRPRVVLELGAGTGDFTIGLAPLVDRLVAIEPSTPMLARGRERTRAWGDRVEWLPRTAEAHAFEPCSAVVAAEALHWMDWDALLPCLGRSLAPGGFLVLAERAAAPLPWDGELRDLVQAFSTNRDYRPYDLVTELESRGLLAVAGRAETEPVAVHQPLDDYVESFHSRNGFSRPRLGAARAEAFDSALRALVGDHCRDAAVCLAVWARVAWGRPVGA